jgi:raffinose/stachyose/melibiose transport system substrate-binding protein
MKRWKNASRVAMVLGAILVVLSFASCARTAKAGKTITIWEIQIEDNFRKIFADSVARFEAANKGYKINDVVMANEDYKQKIMISLGSDTAPDIFPTWTGGGMIEYIKANRIADLTEFMNKNNYKDYFMDAGVNMTVYDNKIWAVPVENCSIAAIFYNSAMFKDFGIAVPTTVEELEAACEKIMAKGVIPFGLPNKTKYFGSIYFMYLVDRMAGPDLFFSAANRNGASFEDPVYLKAGQKLQEWAKKGYFGKGYNSMDGETGQHRQMFYNKECAMILDGSWVVSSFITEKAAIMDDIKIMPFPMVSGGKGDPNNLVGTIGDNFYCINSATKDKEKAFEFIKYIIDDKAVKARIEAGRLPPTKNAYAGNDLNTAFLELIKKAQHIQLWYDQYLPSDMAEIHKDSLQALIGLDITPQAYNKIMEENAVKLIKK